MHVLYLPRAEALTRKMQVNSVVNHRFLCGEGPKRDITGGMKYIGPGEHAVQCRFVLNHVYIEEDGETALLLAIVTLKTTAYCYRFHSCVQNCMVPKINWIDSR